MKALTEKWEALHRQRTEAAYELTGVVRGILEAKALSWESIRELLSEALEKYDQAEEALEKYDQAELEE